MNPTGTNDWINRFSHVSELRKINVMDSAKDTIDNTTTVLRGGLSTYPMRLPATSTSKVTNCTPSAMNPFGSRGSPRGGFEGLTAPY